VSLSDITQLLGTGSVPIVIAGTVFGVFELGEKLASQRAKDALSKWLLTFDVRKAQALPDGAKDIFERIFGERQFSLKCFFRSAAFSLGAMLFIGIIVVLIEPKTASKMNTLFFDETYWLDLSIWLPWSILMDYISLFKTRVILSVLTRRRKQAMIMAVALTGIDFIIYRILFTAGILLCGWTLFALLSVTFGRVPWVDSYQMYITVENLIQTTITLPPVEDGWSFIVFWAGFVPSIWMWLYVLSLFVTRALLRSERIITWLRWGLDVEKTPFRSIGAVAATLAFIATVAIILVSAEVSRIGGAA
jgi:hypothetical protein